MGDDQPGRPVWKGIGGAPVSRRYQRHTGKNGEGLAPPHGLIAAFMTWWQASTAAIAVLRRAIAPVPRPQT
jgi:hypothetical protein